MMLQASSLPDPNLMLEHVQLVLDGRVSPLLLWEKHPVALAGNGRPGADPAPADASGCCSARGRRSSSSKPGMAGRGRGGR